MTLLGQAKIYAVSTQRILPADNPTSRIPPLRTGTQTSAPERSNSTTSTHSLQASSDTRKVRDNYERILKQLEVNAGLLFGECPLRYPFSPCIVDLVRCRKRKLTSIDNEPKVPITTHRESQRSKIKSVSTNSNSVKSNGVSTHSKYERNAISVSQQRPIRSHSSPPTSSLPASLVQAMITSAHARTRCSTHHHPVGHPP